MKKIITEELVDLNMEVKDYEEAIHLLAKKINASDRLHNFDGYYQSVLERERLTSTGIGFGIAIPHGKCPHVKETTVAFGRIRDAINWESLDGEDVTIVFLLAVPEACKGDEHLRIIASLSRKLIHKDFREKLITAESKENIVDLLSESLIEATA